MTAPFFALFPGQGSQKVGMGKKMYEARSLVRDLFAEADEVLGFSLSKLCFEGPEDALTQTAHAQPAILTVSTAAYLLWSGDNPEGKPTVAAGHSLGEYSALVAAKSIAFKDAVLLVRKRGTFMQEAVAKLFRAEGDEAAAWNAMKMRRLYLTQVAVLGGCKDAARTLEEILLENA